MDSSVKLARIPAGIATFWPYPGQMTNPGIRQFLAILMMLTIFLSGQASAKVHFYPLLLDSDIHWFSSRQKQPGLWYPDQPPGQGLLQYPDTDNLESRIRQLEALLEATGNFGDVYDYSSIEALDELANAYRQTSQYPKAKATLEKRLFLARINYGLFHEEHIETLRKLVENSLAMRDTAHAHTYQEALLNLQQKIHGMENPILATAYADWADWHLQAFLGQLQNPGMNRSIQSSPLINIHFFESMAFFQKSIELIHADREKHFERSSLLQASIKKLQLLNLSLKSNLNPLSLDDSFPAAGPPNVLPIHDFGHVHRELTKGKNHLDEGNLLHAIHILEEADWQLLNNNVRRASTLYEQARKLIVACGPECTSLADMLTAGIPVPDPYDWHYFQNHSLEFSGYIDVQLEIDTYGYARNPQVLDSMNSSPYLHELLLDSISSGKFRPDFPRSNDEKSGSGIRIRYFH